MDKPPLTWGTLLTLHYEMMSQSLGVNPALSWRWIFIICLCKKLVNFWNPLGSCGGETVMSRIR